MTKNFDMIIEAGEQYFVELPSGELSAPMTMDRDTIACPVYMDDRWIILETEDGKTVYMKF